MYGEWIEKLKKKVEHLGYKRLQKQEEFQQVQMEFQQLFSQTNEVIFIRKGGIIELERLQQEEATK